MEKKVLAFDFGASGGRAMCGTFDGDKISIEELHRFSNDPVILNGSMYRVLKKSSFLVDQSKINSPCVDTDTFDFSTFFCFDQTLFDLKK